VVAVRLQYFIIARGFIMSRATTKMIRASITALGLSVSLCAMARARIVRIQITKTESPTFEGRDFGNGPYEKLVGVAYGELDPHDRRNAIITDIGLAPRNARGMVEYSMSIYILKPVDVNKGNHRLIYDATNRGNKRVLGELNQFGTNSITHANDPTTAADAGNGWLMRQGYTIAWSGWDGSVPNTDDNTVLTVPTARNRDGTVIVGPSLEEFEINDSMTVSERLSYPAYDPSDMTTPELTVREHYSDPPVRITNWRYVNASEIELTPRGTCFTQGRLYEFTYNATAPKVLGIGFAAVRDLVSFLRHGKAVEGNPLAGQVQHTYSFAISQPARMFRDFVYLGFNEDEGGNRVLDGIENYIAGANGIFMNYRFAQPDRTERQHINRWYPEGLFPFAWQITHDPITGRTDGRLRRCQEIHTCPKIVEAYSENEYWAKANSLLTTDPEGRHDLPDPPNARFYLFSSLQHGNARGPGICAQPRNPITTNAGLRALLVALDEWVSKGKEPPPSQVPRLADGTLVPALPQSRQGFPQIPGVTYNGLTTIRNVYDRGPGFGDGILSIVPPEYKGKTSPTETTGHYVYPTYVPKDDSDGINLAGVHLPDITVPVATYTGWALQGPAFASGDGCDAAGQMIPFAKTKADREHRRDPRPSLEERYPTHQAYVAAVTRSANALKAQRFLIDEDVKQYIAAAKASPVGN
jgi:hypothetical protein